VPSRRQGHLCQTVPKNEMRVCFERLEDEGSRKHDNPQSQTRAPICIKTDLHKVLTLCWANILILPRTTSMPRSSEALSSRTPSLTESPSISRASAITHVVLPIPGDPCTLYPVRARTFAPPLELHGSPTLLLAHYREDHVRHVAVLGNRPQTLHRIFIAHYFVELLRPVLFHPATRAIPRSERPARARAQRPSYTRRSGA
jgi:hypothetical protein